MHTRPRLDLTFFNKLFGNPAQSAWLISPDIYSDETELAANCRNYLYLPTIKHLYLHALSSSTYLAVVHGYLKVHLTEVLALDHIGHESVKRFANLLHKKKHLNVLAIDNLADDSVKCILDTLTRIALNGRAIVLKCGMNISHHLVVDINDYNATLTLGYKSVIPTESSTAAMIRQFAPQANVLISSDPNAHRQRIELHSAEHNAAIVKAQEILLSVRPSILSSPFREHPRDVEQINADRAQGTPQAPSPFTL